MKTFIFTTIIFITSFITSCITDDPPAPIEQQLPPATMEGKNTFGCKVNGKVWVPSVQTLGVKKLQVSYINNSLTVSGRVETVNDDTDAFISATADDVSQEGTYMIPPPPFNGQVYRLLKTGGDCHPPVNPQNSKITITHLDKSARIISGTFEYLNMKSTKTICDTTNIVNITEGRFDVKY